MKKIVFMNRKLNWNISILVILVLLACSLMWILSMNFLNNLLAYTDNSYSYYKSYYYAKAGLELALTEIDNSDVWFSHLISINNPINTNLGWKEEWFNVSILWRSNFLSNEFWTKTNECNDKTALSIPAKWSMTLPMFYDNSSNYSVILSDSSDYKFLFQARKNLIVKNYPLNQYNDYPILDIWVVLQSWDNILWDYIYMTWLKFNESFFKNYFNEFYTMYWDEPWNNNYLSYMVVSNPTDNEIKFCIDAWVDSQNNEYLRPTTKYFISSRWEYRGKTVWLQAIYAQPLPSFFINPYVNTTTDYSQQSSLVLYDE